MTKQQLWDYYKGAAFIRGRGRDDDEQAGYSLWQFYEDAPGRNPLVNAFLGGEADRQALAWEPAVDVPESWYLEGRPLNSSQHQAIRTALTGPIAFIKGPPGTGKTFTILNLASCILHAGRKAAIVSSNKAALENIAHGISRFDPALPNQRQLQQSFAQLGSKARRQSFNQDHPACGLRFSDSSQEQSITAGAFLTQYPIFTTTIHSLQRCFQDGYSYQYDYVIIDETSQVDVIAGLVAMNCAKRIVLVGDDDQLPPVLNDAVVADLNQELLTSQGALPEDPYLLRAERSFLGTCLTVFRPIPVSQAGGEVRRAREVTLNEHYRCHPGIFRFCADSIYNKGRPEADQIVIQTEDTEPHVPIRVLWFEGNYCERRLLSGGFAASKWNGKQVAVFMEEEWEDLLARKREDPELSVCVLSPFRGQLEALQAAIRQWYEAHPALPREEVALFEAEDSSEPPMLTVHKSQGQEFDIVYLLPVEDGDWEWPWSQKRRLVNVAVSRAIRELRIITSAVLMEKDLQQDLTDYYIPPSRRRDRQTTPAEAEQERFLQKLLHYVRSRAGEIDPAGPFGFHCTGLSSIFDRRSREVERRRVERESGRAAPEDKTDLSAWELCLWERLMDILRERRLQLYANVPVRDVLTPADWAAMDRRRQAMDRADWAALFQDGRKAAPASYRTLLAGWAWEPLDQRRRRTVQRKCRKALGGRIWDGLSPQEQEALAARRYWESLPQQAQAEISAAHWEVLLKKYWDDLRSYAAHDAHFDFLLCDGEGRILLAVEADGEQHRFPWTGAESGEAPLPAGRRERRPVSARQRWVDFAYQQECDWRKDELAEQCLGAAMYRRGNRREDLVAAGDAPMAFLRLSTQGSTCLEVRSLWAQAGAALREKYFPIEELVERQLARPQGAARVYRPLSASAALRLDWMADAREALDRYKAPGDSPARALSKALYRLGYLTFHPTADGRGFYCPTERSARHGIVRLGGLDVKQGHLFSSLFYSPRAVRFLRALLVPDRRRSCAGRRFRLRDASRRRLAALRRRARRR